MVTKSGLLKEANTDFADHWKHVSLVKQLPEFTQLPTVLDITVDEDEYDRHEIFCIDLKVKANNNELSLRGHVHGALDVPQHWDFTGRAHTTELEAFAVEFATYFGAEILGKHDMHWDEWPELSLD